MDLLRRNALFVLALVALCVGAIWLRAGLSHDSGSRTAGSFDIGGPFTLVGPDGQPVNEHSWPGKLLLIDFGYRYCPDVCPTNLQSVATALEKLGADAARVQPLFVTIDPERDARPEMNDYVAQFHPRLIGLTGTPAQIAAVAKTFRVYYRKVPGGSADAYTMDHSAFTYLASEGGVVLKLFGHDTSPDLIAAGVRDQLARLKS